MSKKTVLNALKLACNEDDIIVEFDYKDNNDYHATIRRKVEDQSDNLKYSQWCDKWIEKFGASTASNWIVRYTYPSAKKYIYRKVYKCQFNSFDKVKVRKRRDARVRDRNCNATVNILIKKVNLGTIKNDHYLQINLNVVIEITFVHNHNVMVAEAFSYLRMSSETKSIFLKYFDDGMTPATARSYHEMYLESEYEGSNFFVYLSNAQINPTERQVNHLYSKWRTTNFDTCEEKSILEVLEQKEAMLNEAGFKIITQQKPLIILILTPIMLRAHKRDFAHEMIFIDSSGFCDQTNTCVTFLFAAAKIGTVPLACVFHAEQSEANYTLAFELLRETLGNQGFGGHGFPNVIITDDCLAERNALKTIFPESSLLLCIFHMTQAFWRWLWDSQHMISEDHRRSIMREFQRLFYSTSEEDAQEIYKKFVQNECHLLYQNLIEHMKTLWERKNEWILCFQSKILTRGNNTYNFADASIRIFKDVVLQRCKAFNACALVDFLVNIFESYHRRHLLAFANTRKVKNIDRRTCLKCQDVIMHKIDENTFRVSSSCDEQLFYTTYVDICFCDCISGQGGRFCKHLCAIQQKFGLTLESTPSLTLDNNKDFAKIALGDDISTSFFNSMELGAQEVIQESNLNDDVSNTDTTYIQPGNVSASPSRAPQVPENDEQHSFAVGDMSLEFQRITNIATSCNSVEMANTIIKLTRILKKVETPAQLLSLFHSLPLRRGTRIGVQPTSVSRRELRPDITSGDKRMQTGRPAKQESGIKRKRARSLQANIDADKPNAKSH